MGNWFLLALRTKMSIQATWAILRMCAFTTNDDPWLWHQKLGHENMKLIKNLSTKDHVRGIPKINYQKDHICDACEIGK